MKSVEVVRYSFYSFRLDGLNKELDPWYEIAPFFFSFYSHLAVHVRDTQYYMGEFRALCAKEKMAELCWPRRDYIVQIARFDPAKGKTSLHNYFIISMIGSSGINHVIQSYYMFRKMLTAKSPDLSEEEHPQLLICGHGAVDDPDASIIYDQVIQLIASAPYNIYLKDIVVMRLPPSDQRAFSPPINQNHSHIVQFSTR